MAFSQDRLNLPWTNEGKENKRFTLILTVLFVIFLVLSIWVPSVILPEKDRQSLEKLPPQLAKFVKKKIQPKPVKKKEAPKKKEPLPKKEKPKKKPENKPKPKKVIPKLKKPKVVNEKKLTKKVKKAREVAKKSGLLALQSDLADLKSAVDVSALKKKIAPRREKTIAAKAGSASTADVMRRSSGIQTTELAAPAETLKLASRDGAVLEATADEIALAQAEAEAALRVNFRSDESIMLMLEGLKAPIDALYNRELRNDPFLEGLLVLELTIEPSGEVSSCDIVSSALNHKKLERKIVNRVLLHDFGAEDVVQRVIKIPFNLKPS